MKQPCPFILAFFVVLMFQYARCESYKEWYEKTVKHCIQGTTFKSYTPNFVCICALPGVIENCQFVGMVRDARGTSKLLSKGTGSIHYCSRMGPDTFFDGCNWCQCKGMTAQAVCTNLPCIKLRHKKDKTLNGLVSTAVVDYKASGPSNCTEARYKHPDGCNWCTCNNGWEICTRMSCVKKLSTSFEYDCKNNPQGKWAHPDNCNLCYCMDENTLLCTIKTCDSRNKLDKAKDPKTQTKVINECIGKPAGRFMSDDGCNWCYCIGNSSIICTIVLCPITQISLEKRISSSLCEKRIGETFSPDSCNTCYCDAQGMAMCTLQLCSKRLQNDMKSKLMKDKVKRPLSGATLTDNYAVLKGETKKTSQDKKMLHSLKEKAQSCKTGQKFKEPRGCNWCTCIEDGVVVCDTEPCY